MGRRHADRRDPEVPDMPADLSSLGDGLLEEAATMSSGRASRTLTPGAHEPLKQTLVALQAGQALSEHTTNGPATIHLLRGAATINAGDDTLELSAGGWAVIPQERHDLQASEDTVALVTVAVVEV